MQEILQHLAERWIAYKIRLIEYVGLTNDAMHIHMSLLLLFVSAILFRRRPDSLWCWIVVFFAELFNEYADLRGAAPDEAGLDAARQRDLAQAHLGAVVWDGDMVHQAGGCFAGAQPPELLLEEFKGFGHLVFGFQQDIIQ
jgi:hypothetical protein